VRRWLPVRYAGGLSLIVLFLLAVAGAIFLPPQPVRAPVSPEDQAFAAHPDWPAMQEWIQAEPGRRPARCGWPANLRRGGSAQELPGVWLDPGLLVGAPAQPTGAVVVGADGAPHAWISLDPSGCAVHGPARVAVRGQVVDATGAPIAHVRVDGCGTSTLADETGAFALNLAEAALLHAVRRSGPARCELRAGGPPTPIALDAAAELRVVVQRGG